MGIDLRIYQMREHHTLKYMANMADHYLTNKNDDFLQQSGCFCWLEFDRDSYIFDQIQKLPAVSLLIGEDAYGEPLQYTTAAMLSRLNIPFHSLQNQAIYAYIKALHGFTRFILYWC